MDKSQRQHLERFREKLRPLTPEQFRKLFHEVLTRRPRYEHISENPRLPGGMADFAAFDSQSGRRTFFAVRSVETAQPQLVASVGAQLATAHQLEPDAELVLVIRGLGTKEANQVASKLGISIFGILSLQALVDPTWIDEVRESWGAASSSFSRARLEERLKELEPGRRHALEYQGLVARTLTNLFVPPLRAPIEESSDTERRNRRDIVFRNDVYDQRAWQLLRERYAADYVVVDAKNYTARLGKEPVSQIAHYLKRHGLGLFGLLVSRVGAGGAAKHAIREKWIADNKLIVVLDDRDLLEMYELLEAGQDPADVLLGKIDEFRSGL